MEMVQIFLPYLLLLLLPLFLYLVSFIRKNGPNNQKNLPPGSEGWPLLGENMEFALLGPPNFVKSRMNKYSHDVFKTSILGEKMAIFCGAQGNKFIFMNDNKLLTPWFPQSTKKALAFPEFLKSSTDEMSSITRTLRHDILKPEALRKYVPVMDALARKHMESEWRAGAAVKVVPLSKKYTLELACRLFLGVVDPEFIKRLCDPFILMTSGMLSMPLDLPGTAYSRAIKGGRIVREELMRIIKRRRDELVERKDDEGRDMLSKMLLVRGENGELFSEMEICNHVIGLLVASFDTTSSAVATVINYLAELPHIYEDVLKEQMEVARAKGPDALLTWEDIEKMKYSWNVVRESLRLIPPSQGGFKETTSDVTFAGFTIPKGWKVFWTTHSSHKNPKYFPEPEKFDPTRFEGSGPAPNTFVPFGGGQRMCPGREYARLQVLVFMHNVVTRFKLEKTIPNEKMVFYASPTPAHGLPIHLHPHKK